MMEVNEITNNNATKNTTNENFITIAPEKISTSLAMKKNTQPTLNCVPYKYNLAETITTQHNCCFCKCYKPDSIDARCCGICNTYCPRKTVEEQSDCCPNNFTMYWDSGYVQTTSGYGNQDEKNGVCCWFCFPLKFGLFFPCCFGSICNGYINYMRDTDVNYLF